MSREIEINKVRADIKRVAAWLKQAEDLGLAINDPAVVPLNQQLAELRKKENILRGESEEYMRWNFMNAGMLSGFFYPYTPPIISSQDEQSSTAGNLSGKPRNCLKPSSPSQSLHSAEKGPVNSDNNLLRRRVISGAREKF